MNIKMTNYQFLIKMTKIFSQKCNTVILKNHQNTLSSQYQLAVFKYTENLKNPKPSNNAQKFGKSGKNGRCFTSLCSDYENHIVLEAFMFLGPTFIFNY